MQTTLFFDSKKCCGSSENFTSHFNPPLELDASKNYQVCLINASMWYSWYNINNENNKFKYYNGSTWKIIGIPPGAYNIVDIDSNLKHNMKQNGDWDTTNDKSYISITPNYNTSKSMVELQNGYKVNFTIDNSIRTILGFNSKIIENNGFHSSDNIVQITEVDTVQIHCDLITDSYINGTTSSVIYVFTPSVPPGYLINIHPTQRFNISISKRGLINNINFSLHDQNNNLINMNNERVTYFLHISSF